MARIRIRLALCLAYVVAYVAAYAYLLRLAEDNATVLGLTVVWLLFV